jgi:uncharacterized protein YcbK (DUF882 family)
VLAGFKRKTRSLPVRAIVDAGRCAGIAGKTATVAAFLLIAGASSVHNAAALDETRTLSFHHTHSGEDLTVTFKRDGRYNEAALKELNHFLRDWRNQDQTTMDRRLFDILWEVYRDVDGKRPIQIISAYRSPATNAMLRRRSSGVARASQHMLGHAMDFYIPAVPLEQIRFAGLRLQRGGVGFYPTSGSPFVHLDTGNIRHWPRMTHDQLARVFPNGRTVHVPSDGNPLPGYQLAMAEIEKRGDGDSAALAKSKPSLFTSLFRGGKSNDDDDEGAGPAIAPGKPSAVSLMAAAMPAKPSEAQSSDPVPMPRAKPASAASFQIASADDATPSMPRRIADAAPPRPPASIPAASTEASAKLQTPADIINSRGFWDDMPAPKQATPQQVATLTARQALSKVVDPQSSTSAFAEALAYAAPARASAEGANAERTAVVTASAPLPRSVRSASLGRNPMAVNNITSVVAKGSQNGVQAGSRGVAIANRLSAAVIPDNHVWLRAMILAPSATTAMSVSTIGDGDLTVLRAHFVKPQTVVAMGFSDDPQLGLVSDSFTGSATATLATVAFTTRTASLK